MLFVQQETIAKVFRRFAHFSVTLARRQVMLLWNSSKGQHPRYSNSTFWKCVIPPSSGYFMAVSGKSPFCMVFSGTPPKSTLSINGSFDSEAALSEAMTLKSLEAADLPTVRKADFYHRSLSHIIFETMLRNLCVGDFQRKNITINQIA